MIENRGMKMYMNEDTEPYRIWNAVEAERIFIGAILAQPSRLMEVRVGSDSFFADTTRQVFQSIQELSALGEPVDALSVGSSMNQKHSAINWPADLTEWITLVVSDTFFESAQKIIEEEYRKRVIKKINFSLNQDMDADAAIQSLMALSGNERKHSHTMGEAIGVAIQKTDALRKTGKLAGLASGLKLLDDAIAGFQAPDLYVIGGRPAMGKTAVAINLMLGTNAAGFISTEQPMEQIGLRVLSIQGGVSARRLRSAKLDDADWSKLTAVSKEAGKQNIIIHDKPAITISELMREARRMKYSHDIEVLYVDYIQRIKAPKTESRRLEVAEVVTSLKTLARELNIPVIALAQVSREVEKRADKRPHMGDLLESGVIEQEADVVMLLYRDEVYNPDTPDKGMIEIIIDKNRHGPVGTLSFAWIGDQMRVGNLYRQVGNH